MKNFEEKSFCSPRTGQTLRYLCRRSGLAGRQPLLIYLHGAGSRGSELSQMQPVGPIRELEKGREIPAKVLAPQCRGDTWFELFETLIDFVFAAAEAEDVDPNRVYLTGSSMGAYAAWALAMTCPERFAALAAVCGGGMYWNAARLKNLPIWAFHGALDEVVYPEESLKMVGAVNRCGGQARLTVFPHADHNAWDPAFSSDELWAWLFEQTKEKTAHELQ